MGATCGKPAAGGKPAEDAVDAAVLKDLSEKTAAAQALTEKIAARAVKSTEKAQQKSSGEKSARSMRLAPGAPPNVGAYTSSYLAGKIEDAIGSDTGYSLKFESQEHKGAVLFVEIEGLSRLLDRVSSSAGAVDLDVISAELDEFVGGIMSCVQDFEGDVLYSVGDSLVGVWMDRHNKAALQLLAMRAIKCAFEIREKFTCIASIDIVVRMALSAGDLKAITVGEGPDWDFVLMGTLFNDLRAIVRTRKPAEVVVTDQARPYPRHTSYLPPPPPPPRFDTPRTSFRPRPPPPIPSCRPYLPPAIPLSSRHFAAPPPPSPSPPPLPLPRFTNTHILLPPSLHAQLSFHPPILTLSPPPPPPPRPLPPHSPPIPVPYTPLLPYPTPQGWRYVSTFAEGVQLENGWLLHHVEDTRGLVSRVNSAARAPPPEQLGPLLVPFIPKIYIKQSTGKLISPKACTLRIGSQPVQHIHRQVLAAAQKHDGCLVKAYPVDDGAVFLAGFGVPGTATPQMAERCLRFAFEPPHAEYIFLGAPIHFGEQLLAAAQGLGIVCLQSAAQSSPALTAGAAGAPGMQAVAGNSVVCDIGTRRAVGGAFDFAHIPAVRVDGYGVYPAPPAPPRPASCAVAVGMKDLLNDLLAAVDDCAGFAMGAAVLLTGGPSSGKTTLRETFASIEIEAAQES
eukprot:tig00000704_g3305.t1